MAINLPQAILTYQVRKSAKRLGIAGTVAGIGFSYLQTRRPRLSLLLGTALLGYHLYSQWRDMDAADGETNGTGDSAPAAMPPASAET